MRSSSAQCAPNVVVHLAAHETHVSASGREAWRLRMVWSKITPRILAAAAFSGTASAGHGIAHRSRCTSHRASVLSSALKAAVSAARAAGASGTVSRCSLSTASSTLASRRVHRSRASMRRVSRRAGRRPAAHSRKIWAGCSCPCPHRRQGRAAARGWSGPGANFRTTRYALGEAAAGPTAAAGLA